MAGRMELGTKGRDAGLLTFSQTSRCASKLDISVTDVLPLRALPHIDLHANNSTRTHISPHDYRKHRDDQEFSSDQEKRNIK